MSQNKNNNTVWNTRIKKKTLNIFKNIRLQFHKVLSLQKKTLICNIIALAAMQQSR